MHAFSLGLLVYKRIANKQGIAKNHDVKFTSQSSLKAIGSKIHFPPGFSTQMIFSLAEQCQKPAKQVLK